MSDLSDAHLPQHIKRPGSAPEVKKNVVPPGLMEEGRTRQSSSPRSLKGEESANDAESKQALCRDCRAQAPRHLLLPGLKVFPGLAELASQTWQESLYSQDGMFGKVEVLLHVVVVKLLYKETKNSVRPDRVRFERARVAMAIVDHECFEHQPCLGQLLLVTGRPQSSSEVPAVGHGSS